MLEDPRIPLYAGAAGALIITFTQFLYFVTNIFSFYSPFFNGFVQFLGLIGWVLILAFFGLKLFVLFKK